MVLYPPQILGGTLPGCIMPGFESDFYIPLAYFAYRLNVTFNSGYFARVNEGQARQYCQNLHEQIQQGRFDDDTIYVVHQQYWDLISRHIPNIMCGQLSDYIACISSRRQDTFRDFLEQHRVE
jgi:hypothetical protein